MLFVNGNRYKNMDGDISLRSTRGLGNHEFKRTYFRVYNAKLIRLVE